jgi:hypothetical protein
VNSYRNDELIEILNHWSRKFPEGFFKTVRLTNRAEASLSWSLTGEEKYTIDLAARSLPQETIAGLRQWWSDHGGDREY